MSDSLIYLVSDMDVDVTRAPDTVEVSQNYAGNWYLTPEGDWTDYRLPGEPTVAQVREFVREKWGQRPRPLDRPQRCLDTAAFFAELLYDSATPETLLGNPYLYQLCYDAARAGRTFTRELCEFAPKAVVQAAVAQCRALVEERAAAEAREQGKRERAAQRQADSERPTRDAVTAAYDRCAYRTCTQGHTLTVRIGGTRGVQATTVNGERYSSRCTFRKMESVHTVTVGADWLATVAARGLDTYSGRLVLSLSSLGFLADGREVVDAEAVRQLAGTALGTVTVRAVQSGATWTAWDGAGELLTARKLRNLLARRAGLDATAPVGIVADRLNDLGLEAEEQAARKLLNL